MKASSAREALQKLARAALLAGMLATARDAAALGEVTLYDNAQGVPVGARAAGMGGAYTALACDEGALHYNPASLSCAASSHLELSANAYVLSGLTPRRRFRAAASRTTAPPRPSGLASSCPRGGGHPRPLHGLWHPRVELLVLRLNRGA